MLATPAKAEPAMWVIKDNDSTIYLIGTVHLLRHETEWNATKVKKAVAESTQLWLEATDVDDLAKVAPVMAQYGVDMEHPLSSKLTPTQKQKLASVAETYSLPVETLESMKPWMAAMLCTVLPLQKAGFDPNSGVDLILKAQAIKEGDQIFGFETAEEQIRFFAELSEADQIAFLDQTLTDHGEGNKRTRQSSEGMGRWQCGDNWKASRHRVQKRRAGVVPKTPGPTKHRVG